MKKSSFRTLVKRKTATEALRYLNQVKAKHSKVLKYDTSTLSISPYLTDNRFSRSERDLLFKLRSRTVQVNNNFQNGNLENMMCDLCNLFTCTHEHVLSCPVLTVKCTIVNTKSINHSFLYRGVDQQ